MKVVQVNRAAPNGSVLRVSAYLLIALVVIYITYLSLFEAFPLGVTQVARICDESMQPNQHTMLQSEYSIPTKPISEKQFTVLMLTNNRTQLMMRCLAHYAQMDSVKKIVVTWSNQEVKPPDVNAHIKFKMPVVVNVLKENKLRMRFDAYDEIQTQGVLTVDDDLIVQESDLVLAFEVWRQHPYGLVGFHRRSHSGSEVGNYRYQYWLELVLRGGYYSMILTGTAFLHRDYLRMYMQRLPAGVAQTVDEYFNCEDIAMNFLVQSHCQCAGIFYVKNRHAIEHFSEEGLSNKAGHKTNRHQCINEFAKFYERMPLRWVNCRY